MTSNAMGATGNDIPPAGPNRSATCARAPIAEVRQGRHRHGAGHSPVHDRSAGRRAMSCSKAFPVSPRPPCPRRLPVFLGTHYQRIQFTPDLRPATSPAPTSLTARPTSSSSARGRSFCRCCWPTRSTAPRPRRSRPSSKRCRRTRSPSRAPRCPCRSRSWCWATQNPRRAGGRLPAARGAAGPLLLRVEMGYPGAITR